jgi:hypothetical protein
MWLLNRFARDDQYEVYRPKERLIYSYFDGKNIVHADPISTYKRLMAVGPELSVRIKLANSPSNAAGQAHEELLRDIRKVFGVKALDEGGLTEIETVDLLDHFLIYCARVKKKQNPWPMPSTPTAASPTTSAAGPATANSSGSGSVENASPTGVPPPSPSESPLHSA